MTLINGKEVTWTADKRLIKYHAQKDEMWARSYAQYIAEKSKNNVMIGQIKDMRKSEWYGYVQWDEEDFNPIKDAIDNLFKKKGWIE